MFKIHHIFLIFSLIFVSCTEKAGTEPKPVVDPTHKKLNIKTSKSRYNPGEMVDFSIDLVPDGIVKVRYRHLNQVVHEHELQEITWQWNAPADDFKGYLVDIYTVVDEKEVVLESIAVDVSSDWTRFPRYGFLSKFGKDIATGDMDKTLDFLLRCRINGLQYYDWHWKHHNPLKMVGNEPASEWQDIINRTVSFNTVKNYIDKAKERRIASMSYNLLFGAWEDYESDGISREWMIFQDASQKNIDHHALPTPPFLSNILLLDPSNSQWQEYIFAKTEKIYEHLDFDGWHMDQLGNRGTVYNNNGNTVNLPDAYENFLVNLRQRFPDKKMVLNSVNQFGQREILSSTVDFAYTEIWNPNESFADLGRIADDNNRWSDNKKNQVFAAYMNYNHANSSGLFNTPSVLLANAVIFAHGSSKIELGEHMLGKEYFPNNNLQMRADLNEGIVRYYDFLTAYQNILRDGGSFNQPVVVSADAQLPVVNWPPQAGKIALVGKSLTQMQVVHFLNFVNVNHLFWRDTDGTQSFPVTHRDVTMRLTAEQQVSRVWYASPDTEKGVSQEIEFSQNGNQVIFTLPYLQYWGMVVFEY